MSVIFSWNIQSDHNRRSGPEDPIEGGIFLKGTSQSTVILIHGLTGTPNEMKFLATYLNRLGYSVICPRLANHGGHISILKNSKWQDFYESVRKTFTDERVASLPGPVYTGGLSMGALLALLLADEFPDRVRGVSCLAPTLFYDGWNSPDSKFWLPLGYHTFLKHFFYFKEEPPYGIKNEAVRQRIHRYYNDASLDDMEGVSQYGYPFFPVALLHQLQLLVKHLSAKLPSLKIPVQLIQAKDDDMASVRNSKFIYDRVGSAVKEMILLYDSYHVITADNERDLVAQKMAEFFDKENKAQRI